MPVIRSTVTLPYTTALPQDVATNTFHFFAPVTPPAATQLDAIDAALITFYNAIDGYIGSIVTRVASACRIEHYNLSDEPPRAPIRTTTFNIGAPGGSSNLPLECAAVLSFQGARESGQVQARRRGRIYVGPLRNHAVDGSLAIPALDATFITTLTTAAAALAAATDTDGYWGVYSTVNNATVQIDNGWVDNAVDTQRRREGRATSRTNWSA